MKTNKTVSLIFKDEELKKMILTFLKEKNQMEIYRHLENNLFSLDFNEEGKLCVDIEGFLEDEESQKERIERMFKLDIEDDEECCSCCSGKCGDCK